MRPALASISLLGKVEGFAMSFLSWVQKLLVGSEQDASGDVNDLPELEDNQPFVFGQHLRIIAAIVIAFISALFMWWIVA